MRRNARSLLRNLRFAVRRPDMALQRLRGQPLLEISLERVEAELGAPPAVILEAGCHDGSDTASMARTWPHAKIHATEPLSQGRARARSACAAFDNVTIDDFALSDVAGDATMQVSSRSDDAGASGSSTLLPSEGHQRVFPEVRFDHEEQVRCRTLDGWFVELGVSAVDLLWLDVQGMELRVLAASSVALASTRAVHLEVSRAELFEGSGLATDVERLMNDRGFHRAIDRIGPVFGNVLYLRD